MALWGNNDSKNTKGTDGGVGLVTNFNYNGTAHGYGKLTLFGSNTQWGETGHADEGDVIRIGRRGAGINKYFGDLVVVSVATTERCTVASSESVVGTAVTNMQDSKFLGTSFTVSQMPVWCTQNLQGDKYRNQASAFESDSLVFGISNATAQNSDSTAAQAPSVQGQFKTDAGWVGVTTYIDSHGNYRVKQEVLVAMSGITTGSIDYYTCLLYTSPSPRD